MQNMRIAKTEKAGEAEERLDPRIEYIPASDEFIRKYGRTLEIRHAADARLKAEAYRAVPRYVEALGREKKHA